MTIRTRIVGLAKAFGIISPDLGDDVQASGSSSTVNFTSSDLSIEIEGNNSTGTVDFRAVGGGGGTPGGVDGDVQYNNGGAFGGFGKYDDANDRLGVKQETPLATVHAGASTYTVGNASSLTIATYTMLTSGGKAFGTAYTYNVYGKRTVTKSDASTQTIYSATPASVVSTGYSIVPGGSSGTANYSGTGYTADGTDFSFTVWPLYTGDTLIGTSAGYSVTQDSSFNPYSIDHDIVPPTPQLTAPSNYFIRRDSDDTWQVVSGDFSDDNTAWSGDATTQLATYTALTGLQIDLSWSAASNADDYRILNTTSTQWTDKGGTGTTITDVGTWTAGTPTTTPAITVYDIGVISDGDAIVEGALNHDGPQAGFFGGALVTQPSGDLVVALGSAGLNLVNTPTISGTSVMGTAYHVAAFDGSGMGTSSADVIERSNALGIGFGTAGLATSVINANSLDIATQLNVRRGSSITTGGTQSNVPTTNISRIYNNAGGTTTFTGFANGYDGKFLLVTNGPSGTIAFAPESASSTAANRIITGFSGNLTSTTQKEFLFVYDGNASRWKLVGGDGAGLLASSNNWTSTNAFNGLVSLQQAVRFTYVEKTADYTLTTSDGNIQYNSSSNRVLTLYSANVTSSLHFIKNTGTGTVTINTTGGQLIDGYSSGQIVLEQHDCILLTTAVSGTVWRIAGFWKYTTAGRITFGDANGVPATDDDLTFSTAAGLVGNESGGTAVDLRWESDSNTHQLFVDASANAVGINASSPGSSLDVGGSFQCDSITNDTGLAHGTYTPTLTNVANLDSSTAFQCQYMRVGNTVTVSGKVTVDPTTTVTSTQLGISLPVASNLGAEEDCAGTAFCPAVSGQGAAILADAANNRAQMQWIAADVTSQSMFFTFTYEVI